MSFTTLDFALFMAVVYGLYLCLGHRAQNLMLLVASYVFYGSWSWPFLSLIALSTVVDYFAGLRIHGSQDEKTRWRWLVLSMSTNLGLLGVFKYCNFFAQSFADLLDAFGVPVSWTTLSIVLPVGISFYTFQTMSYTIDIYRRKLEPTRNFLDFALFVSFFPQLVAGPIERATHLLPQVLNPRRIEAAEVTRGGYLILLGLVKKLAVADGVARVVDAAYGSTGASWLEIVGGTVLFAVQIYCDFSGYSDVARGVSKLMGFDLMVNFRCPYFSTNPSEFWRRWHISLSTWLRDYLYIPLGGNRGGEASTYRNLMTTMTLGGLWHGASWNFVLWGVYQGAILCVHRLATGAKAAEPAPPASIVGWLRRLAMIAFFFAVTCYGWLLFRATPTDAVGSFELVSTFTTRLFTDIGDLTWRLPRPTMAALAGLPLVLVADAMEYLYGSNHFYRRWPHAVRGAFYAALILAYLLGLSNESTQFIYFQF